MMTIKHKTARHPRTVATAIAQPVRSDNCVSQNITKAEKALMNAPANRKQGTENKT